MTRSKLLVALLVGLLLPLVGGGLTSVGHAAATTQITSFTGPTEPVDLETSPGALFSVHMTDTVGIREYDPNGMGEDFTSFTYLLFREEGSTVSGGGYAEMSQLVSGTPQDGEFEFGPFAGKRAFGNWEPYRMHIARIDGTTTEIDLAPLGFDKPFRVIGRFGAFIENALPSTVQNTLVRYGQRITLRGRLIWIDELGRRYPIPGVTVTISQEEAFTEVDEEWDPVATGKTAADGTFAIPVVPQRSASRLYSQTPQGTSPEGVRYMDAITWTGRVDVQVRINITSRPTSLPAGSVGYVEGNVVPLHAGQLAYLQRYTNQGWRTVSKATIRSSGRFTLPVQPPGKTTYRYRVYKASDADHLGFTTPVFLVTGT
jgi:hypothetical protein